MSGHRVSQVSFASSSPSGTDAPPWRGHVDRLGETGVEGWAVDLDDISAPLQLELMVEDTVVARCTTEHDRPDLTRFLGQGAKPGFSFELPAIEALRRLHRAVPNAQLRVRFAGTELALRSELGLPSLAAVFASNRGESGRATSARDLLARMSSYRASLGPRLQLPFRPVLENCIGFIEAVMVDRFHVWLIGWMRRGEAPLQPAVVFDGQKISAALAFFTFERDDLTAQDCGFIGLLTADWHPTSGRQLRLFLGKEQAFYLNAATPLPILSDQTFGERFDDHLPSAGGPNVRLLQQVLSSAESWVVRDGLVGFATAAAIDRILVLPQFGVLVDGWVLCSAKRWVGLAVRFGSVVLGCDPASIRGKPRLDLLEEARGVDELARAAGFTAALPGLLPVSEIDSPVLKVTYEDGTTSNHAIDPACVVRLPPGAALGMANSLFPALVSEPFFPAFARGLIEDLGALTRAWSPHKVVAAQHVVMVTLGRSRPEIFCVFAELTRLMAAGDAPPGIVLLAERGEMRVLVTQLFAQFELITKTATSLFFLEDADYALYALPAILVAVGAECFAFFDRPAMPTETGWQAALAALHGAAPLKLILLGSSDPVMPGSAEVSARCFVWDRWAFADWVADQPVLLGGGSGLPWPETTGGGIAGAARLTATTTTSRIAAAVNRVAAA